MRSRLAATLAALALLLTFTPAAASASAMEVVTRLDSGTLRPGEQKSFQVNIASYQNSVVDVSLLPYGAVGTAQWCTFRLVRTWYEHVGARFRLFRFTIANIGEIPCGTEIVVGAVQAFRTWSATINTGAQRTWHWNNANPLNTVHMAGVTPRSPSPGSHCKFQVTRTWYVQQPSGEREFYLTVRNTGPATCDADIMLARKKHLGSPPPERPADLTWLNPGEVTEYLPGYPSGVRNQVIVPGLIPWGDEDERPCRLEIIHRDFHQTPTTGGTRASHHIKNIGSNPCGYHALFTSLN